MESDEPFRPIIVSPPGFAPDEIEYTLWTGEKVHCLPVPSEHGVVYIPEWFGITCWG